MSGIALLDMANYKVSRRQFGFIYIMMIIPLHAGHGFANRHLVHHHATYASQGLEKGSRLLSCNQRLKEAICCGTSVKTL